MLETLPSSIGESARTDLLKGIGTVSTQHICSFEGALRAEGVMRGYSLSVDK